MSTNNKDSVFGIDLMALLCTVVFFGLLNIVNDEPDVAPVIEEVVQSDADQCMPEDVGVMAVMWLEHSDEGLKMNCEKHAKVAYGKVSTVKPKRISFLVPVEVD